MSYIFQNLQANYNDIALKIIKIREQLYDLVEIPHLLEETVEVRFQKDAKQISHALKYIIDNHPSSFSNKAKQGTQMLFTLLIAIQEEFLSLEEVYYQNFTHLQNTCSPKTFKKLMNSKDSLQKYFL